MSFYWEHMALHCELWWQGCHIITTIAWTTLKRTCYLLGCLAYTLTWLFSLDPYVRFYWDIGGLIGDSYKVMVVTGCYICYMIMWHWPQYYFMIFLNEELYVPCHIRLLDGTSHMYGWHHTSRRWLLLDFSTSFIYGCLLECTMILRSYGVFMQRSKWNIRSKMR